MVWVSILPPTHYNRMRYMFQVLLRVLSNIEHKPEEPHQIQHLLTQRFMMLTVLLHHFQVPKQPTKGFI